MLHTDFLGAAMSDIVLAALLSMTTALIMVIISLFLRIGRLSRSFGEIRAALLGYEGSGGLIQRLDRAEKQIATVDDRIVASRHQANNQMQSRLTEVEMRIIERIEESDQRVKEEIKELKEELNHLRDRRAP